MRKTRKLENLSGKSQLQNQATQGDQTTQPVQSRVAKDKLIKLDPIIKSKKKNSPERSTIKGSDTKAETEYQSTTLSKKEKRMLKKAEITLKVSLPEDTKGHEIVNQDEIVEEGKVNEDEDEDLDLDFERLAASGSESDIDDDSSDEDDEEVEEEDDEVEEDDDEVEEDDDKDKEDKEEEDLKKEDDGADIPLSEVEMDSDADIVPHTKLTINNKGALKESLARIQLPWEKHAFTEHQLVTSAEPAEALIKDIYDDTQRELAFYKQGLDAVEQARINLRKLEVPFSRPMDYFAEMVKSDEHMDKLKNKLLMEAANRKASEDAKKQRSLKKFGKQVQHATLQDRAKQKKETLEKIKSLKKKRAHGGDGNDDEFKIALEEATSEFSRSGSAPHDSKRHKPNPKRLAKNARYGLGGQKRGSRTNDKESSADVSGFNSGKMKGKPLRPGKSKRTRRN